MPNCNKSIESLITRHCVKVSIWLLMLLIAQSYRDALWADISQQKYGIRKILMSFSETFCRFRNRTWRGGGRSFKIKFYIFDEFFRPPVFFQRKFVISILPPVSTPPTDSKIVSENLQVLRSTWNQPEIKEKRKPLIETQKGSDNEDPISFTARTGRNNWLYFATTAWAD